MRVPTSTYRFQFHGGFKLSDAEGLAGYLHDLGITDVYSSPLLKARTGSTHGYDVTDPERLNPEIGTDADLDRFSAALQSRDMGLILDIVPNHMAASVENPWWRDVLQNGPDSAYASFFDIDWRTKLLLPVLPKQYGDALEQGDFTVRMADGAATLECSGMSFPLTLAADSDASNSDGLDRLLAAQPYRLAHWKKAADAINYRRFFDVGDLVSLRTEREEVFEATHAFILDLVRRGVVTGLRIDHIDGLRDPEAYLERLPPAYVVVEKILGSGEQLPSNWRVWGTTGYDFLNAVNASFIHPGGYQQLRRFYAEFTGNGASLASIFVACKRQIMHSLFAGEVRTLVDRLAALADEHRHARDFARTDLEEAFVNTTAWLAVYRTYIRSGCGVAETDGYRIEDAITAARREHPSPAYAFVRSVLTACPPPYLEHRRAEWMNLVLQWQQFTGPIMAKGLEDTAFYIYNPLVSLNEVGGNPIDPENSFGVEEFHRRMHQRRARWPYTMNASSTHDNKRSEDARARINVLSEIPKQWSQRLKRWTRWNAKTDNIPDRNEESLIYQAMIGAWPIGADRLGAYVVKSLREAKVHSSWIDTNEEYESRVLEFVERILDPRQSQQFLDDFKVFHDTAAFHGALSSLSQTLLKMTAPGIPDFYQGQELWEYRLTDPDNRAPVDFGLRTRMLDELRTGVPARELLSSWRDGRLKMYVIWKTLQFRKARPDLFLRGDYVPLAVTGMRGSHLIAFARRHGSELALVVAPRLTTGLTRTGRWPLGLPTWGDTKVDLPGIAPFQWTNIFTGQKVSGPLYAAQLLESYPVALFHS